MIFRVPHPFQKFAMIFGLISLVFFLSSCGTDGGSDSIFENSGASSGGGGGVGFGSGGPGNGGSGAPGNPGSSGGSDPSDGLVVDIPQKNGATWVMSKTRLSTITKYNIYNSLTSYYTDRSNQVQTQMSLQTGMPGLGNPLFGASGSLLQAPTPAMGFPGSSWPPANGIPPQGGFGGGGGYPGGPQGGGFPGGGYPGGNQGAYPGGFQGGGYPQMGGMPQMNPQMMQYQQQAYMQQGMMQGGAMVQQTIAQLKQQGYTDQQIIAHLTQQEVQDKEDAEQAEKKSEEELQQEKILKEDNQEISTEFEQCKKNLKESEEEREKMVSQLQEILSELVSLIPREEGEAPADALKRIFKQYGIESPQQTPEEDGAGKMPLEDENSTVNHSAIYATNLEDLPEPTAPPLDDLELLEREEAGEEDEETAAFVGDPIPNWIFDPRSAPKNLTPKQIQQLQVLRESRANILEALGKSTALPFNLTQPQEWAYLTQALQRLRTYTDLQ